MFLSVLPSRRVRRVLTTSALAVLCAGASDPAPASAATQAKAGDLLAGAGQADVQPPKTGYFLGGWTRADRRALGQSTRLFANTLVLQRGPRKVALVAVELFAVPAGLQEDVARSVSDLGFDVPSVVIAASHTHSGPGGFANNPTYNTAAPSIETVTDPFSYARFFEPAPADRQLYTFLVRQIAASIRRADADRTRAVAAWGHALLPDLTENRSIEAHLANHGIKKAFGEGRPEQDPDGVEHTIDPSVDVLRVDKLVRKGGRTRRVPIGGYSEFADHGTVVKAENQVYSGDHHATAWREFADRIRKTSDVPKRQVIVNVYPNGAEGDQTAGLKHTGVEGARLVGGREARAMLDAWRSAEGRLSRRPALDLRWTRSCFCGRMTATGPVAAKGDVGIGFLTGSEEGRGPLYDITKVPFEGRTSPVVTDPAQGNKIGTGVADPPPAVPFNVVRIGDGVIATIPGEPTKEIGVRVRKAVLDAMPNSGVTHAVIAGLAGDFIQYVSTPEEYGQQSYEGASTLFGRNEGTFMQERLGELAGALASGAPAPDPYPLDTSYGVRPDGPAFSAGADSGRITTQPATRAPRGDVSVRLAWTGGPMGVDRPIDKPFVRAVRRVGKRWRVVDSDLALDMLWRVDDEGRYTLDWTPVRTIPAGTYRLRVTASKYTLESRDFVVQ